MKAPKVLLLAAFFAGLCSLIYELLISTTSSYFLGDSVRHFSLTIGIYMFSMGIGAYLAQYIRSNLLYKFIKIEFFLGIFGGVSVPILYFIYAGEGYYYLSMMLLIIGIGILTGLEVPLLTRLMERFKNLDVNISLVLSMDYVGALLATLIFPFLLLPYLGVFRSSLLFGMFNIMIGLYLSWIYREELGNKAVRRLSIQGGSLFFLLFIFIFFSSNLLASWQSWLYKGRVVYSKHSLYQRIVMTKDKQTVRLFLNGSLQFSSKDEYRYHELLVHIPFGFRKTIRDVLILGGGDGLALREVLKYPDVRRVSLVDLDESVVKLAKEHPYLNKLNKKSFDDTRVSVYHKDALDFFTKNSQRYDCIIIDLPDPNNPGLSRLYSLEFYHRLYQHLSDAGILVTQATSPMFSKEAFWCIATTLKQSPFLHVKPYHAYLPSFGDWGFVMASKSSFDTWHLNVDTAYIQKELLPTLFFFPKDIAMSKVETNTLDNPKLLSYYLKGWNEWY